MVAASVVVRAPLTAPARPATVLAAFPSAVYLQVGGPADGGGVVALLARDGVRLPLGVVVGQDTAAAPFAGIAAGDRLLVGEGAVRLPGGGGGCGPVTWRVQRWWDPQVPVLGRPGAAAPVGDGTVGDGTAVDGTAVDGAVRGLIGLGPGLTPAGDDVLCGVLAALTAVGDTARRDLVAAAVTRYAHRTTALSAALLHAAADGYGLPELTRLIVAVLRGDPAPARVAALAALLGVGHSSGAALATGALLTLTAPAHAAPDAAPHAAAPPPSGAVRAAGCALPLVSGQCAASPPAAARREEVA